MKQDHVVLGYDPDDRGTGSPVFGDAQVPDPPSHHRDDRAGSSVPDRDSDNGCAHDRTDRPVCREPSGDDFFPEVGVGNDPEGAAFFIHHDNGADVPLRHEGGGRVNAGIGPACDDPPHGGDGEYAVVAHQRFLLSIRRYCGDAPEVRKVWNSQPGLRSFPRRGFSPEVDTLFHDGEFILR